MKTSALPPEPTMNNPVSNRRPRTELVRQAELVISHVLRGGVLLSAAIIVAGVVLFYIRYLRTGGRDMHYQSFPHTLSALGVQLAQGRSAAVIMLGLLILLATPVLRVAVSIIAFALERDWIFTAITMFVLAVLLISFFVLGQGGV